GALKVLPSLITYLNKYKETTRIVLYINGYSRSAAIANVLSTMLIDNNVIDEENFYAYLFETPCGVNANNKNEYNSIFNIVNSADVVSYVAPIEYDLKRVGTDIEIYKENADELLFKFDIRLSMGNFTPLEGDTGFNNDVEFVKYVISYLLEPVDPSYVEVPLKDLSTRENFYNNVEPDISFLAGFVLSLPEVVINKVSESIQSKSLGDLLPLLQEDGLYNFITPILDEYNVTYEADLLKEKCNNALYLIQQKSGLMFLLASPEQRNNLLRTVYFHTLETILPLLINL
ncbi:MAG: hypothetical protein J6X02_05680, partial [Bacilli bacterium]|nr:hypothetical protein [Bacilli bacterium]